MKPTKTLLIAVGAAVVTFTLLLAVINNLGSKASGALGEKLVTLILPAAIIGETFGSRALFLVAGFLEFFLVYLLGLVLWRRVRASKRSCDHGSTERRRSITVGAGPVESGRCGARMEKENVSRKRVVLKLGVAFTAGLLLFIVQFGPGSLWDPLFFLITLAFRSWHTFTSDGVLVIGFSLLVLMLASVGICLWSRRLLWIAYVLIAACWCWAYGVVALFI